MRNVAIAVASLIAVIFVPAVATAHSRAPPSPGLSARRSAA
jgi:hypothetical protein